jgi:hypothetical protein
LSTTRISGDPRSQDRRTSGHNGHPGWSLAIGRPRNRVPDRKSKITPNMWVIERPGGRVRGVRCVRALCTHRGGRPRAARPARPFHPCDAASQTSVRRRWRTGGSGWTGAADDRAALSRYGQPHEREGRTWPIASTR